MYPLLQDVRYALRALRKNLGLTLVVVLSPGIGIFRDWPSPGQYIDIRNENHSF